MFLAERVHFFTGKGGVGKSTIVAALGLAAAERGRRPLIVEMGHRATMETLFAEGLAGRGIAYAPTPVSEGVHAANMDLDEALVDYATQQVRVRRLARRIVETEAMARFFSAAPAVGEIAILRRLEALEAEQRDGAPRWDPILVDLDATGHALMFLSLPRVFAGLAANGPLEKVLAGFTELLRDPARSRLHLVTLPAALPAQETEQLHRALVSGGTPPVELGTLLVNRVPPPPLPASDVQALPAVRAWAESAGSTDALVNVALAERSLRVHQAACEALARLRRAIPLRAQLVAERPLASLAQLGELGGELLATEAGP